MKQFYDFILTYPEWPVFFQVFAPIAVIGMIILLPKLIKHFKNS